MGVRAREAALLNRFEVTGGRSIARVMVPIGWVCCLLNIAALAVDLVENGRNGESLFGIGLSVFAMSLLTLLLFGSRRVMTYGYAGLFLGLPALVFVANLHSTDLVHTMAAMGWLPTFPVIAAILWSSRRSRPLVILITVLSALVVVALGLTDDVPAILAISVLAHVVGLALCVTWAADQNDRKDVDPLTGLPNRVRLRNDLDLVVRPTAGAAAPGRQACLMMLDVDDLAMVSAELGASRADDLLAATGHALEGRLPTGSSAYYLGAGTFAALVRSADVTVAEVAALARGALPDGLTGCVGATVASEGQSPRDLFRSAEASLVRAKALGPGSLDPRTDDQWVVHDLGVALAEGQLQVAYQPIVDLTTGAVVGSEALVRWTHPTRGPVSPELFIGFAEDSGLIGDLGRHVLRTACAEAAAAESAGRRLDRLNVNVSPVELHAAGYARQVLDILESTGLSPRRLVLEVTESSLSGDDGDVLSTLKTLRSHGIRIAIDDFGTGYSSLSRLAGLPIDILKIDKSFVWMSYDKGRDHLLGAIVALADAFGIHTVAEGIETWEQADLLRAHGCSYGQGYLYGRAGSYDDVVRGAGVPSRPSDTPALPSPRRVRARG